MIDPAVVIIFSALFGLATGSFLNVLIIRTHRDMSPWRGRSQCMRCGHQLAWFDNIPLLSFGWLRGKCRYCATTLSWQYPVVEAGTAILFVLVSSIYASTWWLLLAEGITMMLVAITVYDWRWSLLPDSFSIVLGVFGAVFALTHGLGWLDVVLGGVVGAGFFGAQFALSRGRWVGSGDILLGGALGLLLGWRMFGLALLLSYFIGAIIASILLLLRRDKMTSTIPFGPFLAIGGFVAWLWGQQIVDWYFVHALFR